MLSLSGHQARRRSRPCPTPPRLFYIDGDVGVFVENPTREECLDFHKYWRGDDSLYSETCQAKGDSKYKACMTASGDPAELSLEDMACDTAGESCARACDSGNPRAEAYLC